MTRELRHPRGHVPHTALSRHTEDRYIVRLGGLTGNWRIEDTHFGGLLPKRFPDKQAADSHARELNEGAA